MKSKLSWEQGWRWQSNNRPFVTDSVALWARLMEECAEWGSHGPLGHMDLPEDLWAP